LNTIFPLFVISPTTSQRKAYIFVIMPFQCEIEINSTSVCSSLVLL